jgi:hypothetical protein
MVAPLLIAIAAGAGAETELHAVSCGPAALYFLMDRLDRPIALERAEQILPRHEDGENSFEELRDALVHLGFPHAAAYRVEPAELARVRGPVIAFTTIPDADGTALGHFVVMEPRDKGVLIVDSLSSARVVGLSHFQGWRELRIVVPEPAVQLAALPRGDPVRLGKLALGALGAFALILAAASFIRRRVPWTVTKGTVRA